MDHQLVIKFWRKSLEDEAFLATIEDELKAVLGDSATLDGYDVSEEEINLFVITPDPKHSFRRIKTVLENRGLNCHNAEKKKGGLDLSTFGGAMAGGSGGVILEPGDPSSRAWPSWYCALITSPCW